MENKFAEFDPSLPSSGSFHVHMHKTENGFYVGVECIKVDERDADFLIEAFASARGCKPVMASTLVSNPINTKGIKPTYIQLEKEIEALKAELDAVILQNDKLEARLEMLLAELDDIVSTLRCEKDNVVDSVQEVKFQRDALGKQLLISQSVIATQEDFNNALKAERDSLLSLIDKMKAVTPEMLMAAQIRSELGAHACSKLSGAYSLITEIYTVMVEEFMKKATPQQCLRDVQAEAGRAGCLEAIKWVCHSSEIEGKNSSEAADQYAAKVRQGGAE